MTTKDAQRMVADARKPYADAIMRLETQKAALLAALRMVVDVSGVRYTEVMAAARAALALAEGEMDGGTCQHCGGPVNYVGAPGCAHCER